MRLLREAHMKVVNVAVTLGSKKERQPGRFQELRNACDYLGFELVSTAPNGLERINPKTREQDPAHWQGCVQVIRAIIERYHPRTCEHHHQRNDGHADRNVGFRANLLPAPDCRIRIERRMCADVTEHRLSLPREHDHAEQHSYSRGAKAPVPADDLSEESRH